MMLLFWLIICVITGSLIYLWFIAMLFSVISRKFLYSGKAELSPYFIFQITSKECLETVRKGVNSIIKSCCSVGFVNYEIWVVTDNLTPLIFTDSRIKIIVVPDKFKCRSKYKARALEYSRRKRINKVYNGWIYFMDEENWITEQTIKAITNFAKHGNAKFASGPLMFKNGGSKFIWLGDSLRGAECRLCHLGHSFGWWPMHGENLLVYSKVEKDIGWEFECLTEDILFTAYAGERGYRTGWHGGELYSTSPATFFDFIKQRKRWFGGMSHFVLNKNVKVKYKITEFYLLLCWLIGPIFIIGMIANFFYNFIPFLHYYLYFTLIIYSTGYFIGCKGNFYDKLLATLLCCVFGILEGIVALISLVKPSVNFDIIGKK